jgi:hypothetical protein
MPVPTVEPKVSIMDLIRSGWDTSNIAGAVEPDFHTGWWNPNSGSPQVTFTGDDEAFQGATGYGAIEGGGGGPVQIATGVLFANCWAYRDEGAGGQNPKQLVYQMAKEIRRIILANFNTIENLTYVSVISIGDVPPEAGTNPLVFRKAVVIGFNWRTT